MALLGPRETNFKPASRSVSGTDNQALCYVKWNPRILADAAGAALTAATTVEVTANLLDFVVNAADEVQIGTYTGNTGNDNEVVFADVTTVQGLLDAINGQRAGQPTPASGNYVDRWIGAVGDFRPQFTIGAGDGIVLAAANALLGWRDPGVIVNADNSALAVADTFSVSLGAGDASRGEGQEIPTHFESDFISTTAGVLTQVRNPVRRQAEQPGLATFQVRLTGVHCGQTYANSDNVVTIYDDAANILFSENIAGNTTLANADRYNFDNPICVADGSPIWVEAVGTGALTDGPMTVQGFVRLA